MYYKLAEAAKWRLFWDLFVFYSEPTHQKPALVVPGTREDANPSVNDKLHSYCYSVSEIWRTVLSLVPLQFCLLSSSCIVSDIAYSAQRKEQCLVSPLLVFIAL